MFGTIYRMILAELLKVFFLALIGLVGIIMVAGVISETMKNGFGPAQIAVAIPLLLPSLLPYTVPTSTLFATCIVYGRLSADNEILALKAAGVHVVHVVWPAVLVGAATSLVTAACFVHLIPFTGHLLRTAVIGEVEELLYIMLRKDGYIKHPSLSVEIHVQAIHGKKLHDVTFKRKAPNRPGEWDVIAIAREADLIVDLRRNQILVDMRRCQIQQGGATGSGVIENKIWPVDLPPELHGKAAKTRPMDMTLWEMREAYDKTQAIIDKLGADLRIVEARVSEQGPAATQADREQIKNLNHELRFQSQRCFQIDAEWHLRFALSFGCVCFALVGCPVGIWFSKSDYLSAFVICFLPIVTVYYPAMLCSNDLARAGTITAWFGLYAADALMVGVGAALFWRLARN